MKRINSCLLTIGICSITNLALAYPPSLFNGFYVGGGLGEMLTQGSTTSTVTANNIHVMNFNANEVQNLANTQHGRIRDNSFMGDINFGYGHQFWSEIFYLAGEIFVNLASRDDSISNVTGLTDTNPVSFASPFDIVNMSSHAITKLNTAEWGIDVRPGFLWGPDTLIFARIGAAFNRITLTSNNNLSVIYPNAGVNTPILSTVNSQRKKNVTGLRLGAGFEKLVTKKLAVTVDYIYTDYGSTSTNGVGNVNSNTGTSSTSRTSVTSTGAFTNYASTSVTNQQILFGLKYYFNMA